MTDMSVPEQVSVVGSHANIYLEKDIFFDQRAERLVSETTTVALSFREGALLQLLLAGRARKQAVIEAAWNDNGTIVTEASYHQLVRSLRKKFEEIGLPPQSIKTLPRFGLEYLREYPVSESNPASPAADIPSCLADVGTTTAALPESAPEPELGSIPEPIRIGMAWPWQSVLLALPLLVALCIGLMTYRNGQSPMHAVTNDFGIHLFEIGGVQFDAKLLQEIERRSRRGEYVYMARNGPKAWLGICTNPVRKEFSFCRQDYFSLY